MTINEAELRKLAELARDAGNGSDWIACWPSFGEPLPQYLTEVMVIGDDGATETTVCLAPDWDKDCFEERSALMEHIAAANPATILALLSDLNAARFASQQHLNTVEAQQKQIAELTACVKTHQQSLIDHAKMRDANLVEVIPGALPSAIDAARERAVSDSAAEAPKLARILFGLVEGGGPGEAIDIYADGFQADDGDVYVHRAGELLVTMAAENRMLGGLIKLLETELPAAAPCAFCGSVGEHDYAFPHPRKASYAAAPAQPIAPASTMESFLLSAMRRALTLFDKSPLQAKRALQMAVGGDAHVAQPIAPAADVSAPTDERAALTVWYGDMPESNGKSNFTAILMRKIREGDSAFDNMTDGITIDRSEYPDRVRYEADRMRYLIGEIAERPDILDYDANKRSGYVERAARAAAPSVSAPTDERAAFERCKSQRGEAVNYEGDGVYAYKTVQDQWEIWQAARAAAPVSGQGDARYPRVVGMTDEQVGRALANRDISAAPVSGPSDATILSALDPWPCSHSAAPVSGQGASINDDPEFSNLLYKFGVAFKIGSHDQLVNAGNALVIHIDSRPRSEDSRAKVLQEVAAWIEIHGPILATPNETADAIRALASTPQKADNE